MGTMFVWSALNGADTGGCARTVAEATLPTDGTWIDGAVLEDGDVVRYSMAVYRGETYFIHAKPLTIHSTRIRAAHGGATVDAMGDSSPQFLRPPAALARLDVAECSCAACNGPSDSCTPCLVEVEIQGAAEHHHWDEPLCDVHTGADCTPYSQCVFGFNGSTCHDTNECALTFAVGQQPWTNFTVLNRRLQEAGGEAGGGGSGPGVTLGVCDVLTECTNLDPGFACSACPAGYVGFGETGCCPPSANCSGAAQSPPALPPPPAPPPGWIGMFAVQATTTEIVAFGSVFCDLNASGDAGILDLCAGITNGFECDFNCTGDRQPVGTRACVDNGTLLGGECV